MMQIGLLFLIPALIAMIAAKNDFGVFPLLLALLVALGLFVLLRMVNE